MALTDVVSLVAPLSSGSALHVAVPSRPSRVTEATASAPRLHQALAVVIAGGHLAPDAGLSCFRANRALRDLMLYHAPRTHLTLFKHYKTPANSSSCSSGNGSYSGTGIPDARVAAQKLAAQSRNVSLSLHYHMITPEPCLWQSITSISLHHMQLRQAAPSESFSRSDRPIRAMLTQGSIPGISSRATNTIQTALQLHQLPRVHTLSLQSCHLHAADSPESSQHGSTHAASLLRSSSNKSATSGNPTTGPTPPSTTIRTLECMHCQGCSESTLRMILTLMDPSQLQTLITDKLDFTSLLTQLPALQELRLLPPCPSVGDLSFQHMLAHPRLARVQAAGFSMQSIYSDRPCRWDTLDIFSEIDRHDLGRLPLAGIKRCTVHGQLSNLTGSATTFHADMAVLRTCPELVFQPTMQRYQWALTEPIFSLHLPSFAGAAHSDHIPQLLSLVMDCMRPGPFAMTLYNMDNPRPAQWQRSEQVRASLAATPPTLTTVCFCYYKLDSDSGDEEGNHEGLEPPPVWGGDEPGQQQGQETKIPGATGLLAALPAHVTHVLLATRCTASLDRWLRCLRVYLMGVTRSLRLTLWDPCLDEDRRELIMRWLAMHASSNVQVDFRGRVPGAPAH